MWWVVRCLLTAQWAAAMPCPGMACNALCTQQLVDSNPTVPCCVMSHCLHCSKPCPLPTSPHRLAPRRGDPRGLSGGGRQLPSWPGPRGAAGGVEGGGALEGQEEVQVGAGQARQGRACVRRGCRGLLQVLADQKSLANQCCASLRAAAPCGGCSPCCSAATLQVLHVMCGGQ